MFCDSNDIIRLLYEKISMYHNYNIAMAPISETIRHQSSSSALREIFATIALFDFLLWADSPRLEILQSNTMADIDFGYCFQPGIRFVFKRTIMTIKIS